MYGKRKKSKQINNFSEKKINIIQLNQNLLDFYLSFFLENFDNNKSKFISGGTA